MLEDFFQSRHLKLLPINTSDVPPIIKLQTVLQLCHFVLNCQEEVIYTHLKVH